MQDFKKLQEEQAAIFSRLCEQDERSALRVLDDADALCLGPDLSGHREMCEASIERYIVQHRRAVEQFKIWTKRIDAACIELFSRSEEKEVIINDWQTELNSAIKLFREVREREFQKIFDEKSLENVRRSC